MSKIATAFQDKKAFIAYLMGGDPHVTKTREFILEMERAGADLIEIGLPFSDPIAEGEVIQEANIRALSAGTTVDSIFEMLLTLKGEVTIPLVFMTYLNPVLHYGYDRFFARCAACGVSGIIIPDMPFEEQGELLEPAGDHGIEVITLVAPTSAERIADIAKRAQGFIYLVSSMGVTGVRDAITTDIPAMVSAVKEHTGLPVAVGFGISRPEQVREYCKVADGAIVGSAIVKLIAQYGEEAAAHLARYVAEMKAATEPQNSTAH